MQFRVVRRRIVGRTSLRDAKGVARGSPMTALTDEMIDQMMNEAEKAWRIAFADAKLIGCTDRQRHDIAGSAHRETIRSYLYQAGVLVPEVCVCAAIKLPDGYIVRGHRH